VSDFWKDFRDGLTLTPDEIGYVREILTSKGWSVLTNQVFPKTELDLLSATRIQGGADTEKGSFLAGQYAGFRLSQELAEKTGKPKILTSEGVVRLNRDIALLSLGNTFIRGNEYA